MVSKKILLLAPGVVLGAMVMAADSAPNGAGNNVSTNVMSVEKRENIGKQALLHESSEDVKRANALMNEGKYPEAIKEYRKVVSKLRHASGGDKFRTKIEFCEKRIADCYYQMAEDAMKQADDLATSYDFEAAIKKCEEAVEFCPERREELLKKIEFYKKRREAASAREQVDIRSLNPNVEAQQYQIQLLLEQGIALVKRDEFMKARRKFEQVLLIDPYNEAAMQNIKGINVRLRDKARGRANATARHLLGQVEWAAAIPIVAEAPAGTGENQIDEPIVKTGGNDMESRLRAIIIPNFVLYDDLQTFAQAMEDLRTQAIENQKDKSRVINFVIRDRIYPDPKKVPKLAGYSPGKASLYDILVALQERGDLSFRLDDNAVVIVASGVVLEKPDVRVFSFALRPDDTADRLKEALKAGAQVEFGPGSSLTLIPARNEVVSRNTPINQKRIEKWLAANGDKGVPMVQIMFKFLEVSQNDLDELGFSWKYSRTGRKMSFDAGSNALLRHYSNEDANDRFGGTAVAGATADATYNFEWSDRKNDLTASVYALDWADSADILYSPRVTTLDNTRAKVDMTEQHHYPGDYEDSESERNDDGSGYFIQNPQPTLDDARDLGITFEITPQVNGELIRAGVNFNIMQFDSWLIVDSRNPNNDDDDGEYTKKAVVNNRSISTSVTLKDGETVLIGSISQDVTNTLHDKIPILGDIPFIGRFFQSRYTVSKKNTLLIFMTCKLINPDGSAVYTDPETGNAKNVGGQKGMPVFPQNQ